MCFHTKQTKKVEEIEEHYDVELYHKISDARFGFDIPAYHLDGFTHPNLLIIPQEANDKIVIAKWGIVPEEINPENVNEFYKSFKGQGLNSQSEKAFNYYIYERAIMYRRCIIPFDGFYEPHTIPNNIKIPFHIKNKDDSILSMAGIYSVLEGNMVTCSIFTKKASNLFKKVHNEKNRQPLLLDKSGVNEWLNPNTSEDEIRTLLHFNYNDELLETYPISKDLYRRIDTNNINIIEKVDYRNHKDVKGFDFSNYKNELFKYD